MFNGGIETANITKNCLVNWVVDVYQERRELALSLNDAQTAVHQLHKIVNILLIIVIVEVSFVVLGIAATKVLALVLGQVLVLSFVFNNACKTAFEALVFLFTMHLYDVGDRCVIDAVQYCEKPLHATAHISEVHISGAYWLKIFCDMENRVKEFGQLWTDSSRCTEL